MYLFPCKNPFVTLRKGTTKIANDTHLITKPISWYVFPSVDVPIISFPMLGAKINNIKKIIIDIIDSIMYCHILDTWEDKKQNGKFIS